jgi:hypothetical protein
VATPAERARAYFRFQPLRFPVVADPDLNTHHVSGFWERPFTPRLEQMAEEAALALALEIGLSPRPGQAREALHAFDGFQAVESDQRDSDRQQAMVIGQVLIDRESIARRINLEHRAGVLPTKQQLPEAIARL